MYILHGINLTANLVMSTYFNIVPNDVVVTKPSIGT